MSASIDQTLVQKIDDSREKAISFLQQMIAIPSVTGDEAKIQKFLADYMTKRECCKIMHQQVAYLQNPADVSLRIALTLRQSEFLRAQNPPVAESQEPSRRVAPRLVSPVPNS